MRLKNFVYDMQTIVIDENSHAAVEEKDNFLKLMVYYKNGKPVWVHKDCIVPPKKKQKKNKK